MDICRKISVLSLKKWTLIIHAKTEVNFNKSVGAKGKKSGVIIMLIFIAIITIVVIKTLAFAFDAVVLKIEIPF